jgi:adenylate cyclase
MKKNILIWRHLLLGLITAAVGVFLMPISFLRFEEIGWLLKTRGAAKAPSEVVIVPINQQAARQLGQTKDLTKWSRSLHARLIDQLSRRGVSVIVFDIGFVEPGDSEEDACGAIASGRVVSPDNKSGQKDNHDNDAADIESSAHLLTRPN